MTGSGFFNKSDGIGGLVALCDEAPIEIGNRVWNDLNGDGVQDANEPGISGVTVKLFPGTSSTVTAADGSYYFNNTNVTGGIVPATAYTTKVDTTQPALAGYAGLSPTGFGTPETDSNGTLSGTDSVYAVPAADIAAPGFNNHTYDFGFIKKPVITSTTSTTTTTTTTIPASSTTVGASTTTTVVVGPPITSTTLLVIATTAPVGGASGSSGVITAPTQPAVVTTVPAGSTIVPPLVPTTLPAEKAVVAAPVSNVGAQQPYVALPGSALPFTG